MNGDRNGKASMTGGPSAHGFKVVDTTPTVGQPAVPRKTPCGSCPYRRNVPSGIWDPTEYAKLRNYDGETHEQTATALFMCHQQDGCACSGWLGHRDPGELLAVRLAVIRGDLDEEALDYSTTVPLFESGEAAAEHGLAEIRSPSEKAQSVIDKITRRTGTAGNR